MSDLNYSDKNLNKNAILSGMYRIISMILSFIISPLLLHCLGVEKYGIWVSILSLISWIYYLDFGIGGGLRNRLAESLASYDLKAARGYLATAYFLLSCICAGFLLLITIILALFDVRSLLKISTSENDLNLILLLSVMFLCINFVLSLVNNILYAEQQASKVGLYNVIGQLFFAGIIISYVHYNITSLLFVALAEGFAQSSKNIIESIRVFKRYPELKFNVSQISSKYRGGILSIGFQLLALQLSALVLNETDNLLILRYFGAEFVTSYSFCYRYFGFIQSLFITITITFYSAYTVAFQRRDNLWVKRTLHKSLKIYAFFMLIMIIAMFCCSEFLKMWSHMDLWVPYDVILSVGINFGLFMLMHNFSTFINSIGEIRRITTVVVLGAVLNIPLSVFLATTCNLGVVGVIWGSIIVNGLSCLTYIYTTMAVFKEMGG